MRKRWAVALSLLFLLSCSVPVYAYKYTGYKWSNTNVAYYYENYNTARGKKYLQIGAQAWNDTDVTLSKKSSYNILCSEINKPDVEWDGVTRLEGIDKTKKLYLDLVMYINTGIKETWNNDGALESVAVHEFGHCLGLADNNSTRTIMNGYTFGTGSRYEGYGIILPTTDDENGINNLY